MHQRLFYTNFTLRFDGWAFRASLLRLHQTACATKTNWKSYSPSILASSLCTPWCSTTDLRMEPNIHVHPPPQRAGVGSRKTFTHPAASQTAGRCLCVYAWVCGCVCAPGTLPWDKYGIHLHLYFIAYLDYAWKRMLREVKSKMIIITRCYCFSLPLPLRMFHVDERVSIQDNLPQT